MNRLTLVLAAMAVIAVTDAKPPQPIVGGHLAAQGEIPYIVSLNQGRSHFCGGSIISERHILTAAHCVYGMSASRMQALRIRAGSLSSGSGGKVYTVEKIDTHPSYVNSEGAPPNDIAIVTVKGPITFDTRTRKIDLVTAEPRANTSVVASGWGLRTARDRQTSPVLYTVKIRVVSPTECRKSHARSVRHNHVCAYGSVGHGVCMGDSGGPLELAGRLAGVVSFGRPCAIGHPDVYTSVYHFRDWIRTVMARK